MRTFTERRTRTRPEIPSPGSTNGRSPRGRGPVAIHQEAATTMTSTPEPVRGEGQWTAAPPAPPVRRTSRLPLVTRRRLQVALAVFWLLDGALQLQPFMFTKGFADQVIAPAAAGQPAFVAASVHWSASLIAGHPVFFDATFAAVQLAIGAGLLFARTVRVALAASVAWALGVWMLGEGLGGLGGGATFLAGAPGAVVLYAVIGMAAWPRLGPARRRRLVDGPHLRGRIVVLGERAPDERPARWASGAWAATWVLFAILQALPANDGAGALGAQLAANAATAPGWLAHAERALDAAVRHQGAIPVAVLVAVELAVGLLALRGGASRRVAVAVGIVLALGVWVLGQAFGLIPTGMGTDPSSAPLVALLGLAVLGREGPPDATVRHRRSGIVPERQGDRGAEAA